MWEGVRGREGRESDWGREGGKGANDQYGNRVGWPMRGEGRE